MPIPDKLPITKYNDFCRKYPQYKNCGFEKVCSIMLEQKYLNEFEANELKQLMFYNFKNSEASILNDNFYSYMGLDINDKTNIDKNKKKLKVNYIEKPKIYNKIARNLEVLPNGKVDITQFDLAVLEQKYDKKSFNIKVDKENKSIVINDKQGKIVFSYKQDKLRNIVRFNDNKGDYFIAFDSKNDIKSISTLKNVN